MGAGSSEIHNLSGVSHLRADANITEGREQPARVSQGTLQAQKHLPCFRRRGWRSGCRISFIDFLIFFSWWPDSVSANVKLS